MRLGKWILLKVLSFFSLPCQEREEGNEGNVGYMCRACCKVKIHGDKVSTEKGGSFPGSTVLCMVSIMDGRTSPLSSW